MKSVPCVEDQKVNILPKNYSCSRKMEEFKKNTTGGAGIE